MLADDEAIFVAADQPGAGYLALWPPPAAAATTLTAYELRNKQSGCPSNATHTLA